MYNLLRFIASVETLDAHLVCFVPCSYNGCEETDWSCLTDLSRRHTGAEMGSNQAARIACQDRTPPHTLRQIPGSRATLHARALHRGSTSTSYAVFAACIAWGLLLLLGRAGNTTPPLRPRFKLPHTPEHRPQTTHCPPSVHFHQRTCWFVPSLCSRRSRRTSYPQPAEPRPCKCPRQPPRRLQNRQAHRFARQSIVHRQELPCLELAAHRPAA